MSDFGWLCLVPISVVVMYGLVHIVRDICNRNNNKINDNGS